MAMNIGSSVRNRILKITVFAAVPVFAFLSLASYGVYAQTSDQVPPSTTAAQSVTFPVPELGNCSSKESCHVYCNEAANMPACIQFAKTHGLMNSEEASRAAKFSERLQDAGGPGGCKSPVACQAFCNNLKNLNACTKFAEEHGVSGDNLKEGKKILDYLNSGGALPGGCTSRESCEAYCRELSHVEECVAFAQKAGVGPASAPGQFGKEQNAPATADQIKKFSELAKTGGTPGGCKTKEACESYCRGQSHFEECVAFGLKAGLVTQSQADSLRQTAGRGPGGCNSEESCKAYCNTAAHREECFKFAQDHGLIDQKTIEQTKEGLVRLRQGLEQAPPGIAECLKGSVGTNVISDIQSGSLTPGSEIGVKVRVCFEKFGKQAAPQAAFRDAQPALQVCLKEKLGDKFDAIKAGKTELTPELADVFRVCAQSLRLEQGGQGVAPGTAINQFLRSAPPAVLACVKEKLGSSFSLEHSEQFMQDPQAREKIQACFQNFRPQGGPVEFRGGAVDVPMPPVQLQPVQGLNALPLAVLACLKEHMDPAVFEQVRLGSVPTSDPVFREMVMKCAAQVPAGTTVTPPASSNICIQVITPARDPQTGVCKEFPTPCNVPAGWYKVPSCSTSGILNPPPTSTATPICNSTDTCRQVCTDTGNQYYNSDVCVRFRTYQSSTQITPPPSSTTICSDYNTCKQICTDAANQYYNSPVCVNFRSSQSNTLNSQPSAIVNMIGTMFGPFLDIIAR